MYESLPKLVVFPTIVKLTYAEFYLLQNLFPQVIFFAIVQGSMSSLKAYTEEVKVNIDIEKSYPSSRTHLGSSPYKTRGNNVESYSRFLITVKIKDRKSVSHCVL